MAGRRRPSCRTPPPGRRRAMPSAGDSVCGGRRPGPNSAGWPGLEVEADPTVVEVDAGVRLDEPRSEPGGVRLDQRHAHPVAVDRAQVRGVAVAAGDRRSRRSLRGRRAAPRPAIASSSASPSAVLVQARRGGRSRRPWRTRSARGPTPDRPGRPGSPIGSASIARRQRQVSLRVGRDRVQVDAERRRRAAGRPSRPAERARSSAVYRPSPRPSRPVAERTFVEAGAAVGDDRPQRRRHARAGAPALRWSTAPASDVAQLRRPARRRRRSCADEQRAGREAVTRRVGSPAPADR